MPGFAGGTEGMKSRNTVNKKPGDRGEQGGPGRLREEGVLGGGQAEDEDGDGKLATKFRNMGPVASAGAALWGGSREAGRHQGAGVGSHGRRHFGQVAEAQCLGCAGAQGCPIWEGRGRSQFDPC